MITIEQVKFSYMTGKEVIKGIDLTIQKGEVVAIIGRNGSGKSTLARLIAGITKPSSGKIWVEDCDVTEKKQFLEVRKKIGIVFQNPENQILFSKVKEDMEFALKNLGLDHHEERINQALEQVGIKEYLNADTYSLSLGQKQRIAIAGVLAIQTPYIILDEPTTMIDPMGKEAIYTIIKELKQQGYTILYITNAIDEILLSDRIILLQEGKIVHEFKKKAILEHMQEIEACEIKIPTLVKIVQELQQKGIQINPKEWTMEEIQKAIVKVCSHEG